MVDEKIWPAVDVPVYPKGVVLLGWLRSKLSGGHWISSTPNSSSRVFKDQAGTHSFWSRFWSKTHSSLHSLKHFLHSALELWGLEKQPQTIIPPLPNFSVHSPGVLQTQVHPSHCQIVRNDSSLWGTCFNCSRVQWWCAFHHSRCLALCIKILGLCATCWPWKHAASN